MTPGILSLVLAGAAGAVAGAAIWAVKRSRPESSGLAVGLGVLLFFGTNALLQREVVAPYRGRFEAETAEKEILKIRFYEELKIHEPAMYRTLLGHVIDGARRGTPLGLVGAGSRDDVAAVLTKCLPRASDGAVLGFMHVVLDEVVVLERKSPETAFRFLFSKKGEVLDLSAIPKALQERELDSVAEIVKTGASAQRALLTQAEADALLQRVFLLLPDETRAARESGGTARAGR